MNDRSDDEFTAQERALLATWDRHNAPVAANDECDAAFEHRLIAAYHAAREASLRAAESNDEAICRQIAADALADAGGAATSGAARLEAPAAAVTVSPARLAGVAFAGSALGGVITVLGIGVCGRHLTVEPSHRSTVRWSPGKARRRRRMMPPIAIAACTGCWIASPGRTLRASGHRRSRYWTACTGAHSPRSRPGRGQPRTHRPSSPTAQR
jgi:hypothetical protein